MSRPASSPARWRPSSSPGLVGAATVQPTANPAPVATADEATGAGEPRSPCRS